MNKPFNPLLTLTRECENKFYLGIQGDEDSWGPSFMNVIKPIKEGVTEKP